MSQIKGKNTKPEIMVRKFLFSKGLRFRLHDKKLPGKPDLVLPKYKTVVFVHGCFWHGHENCKYFVLPKTRIEWWYEKLSKNNDRDNLVNEKLLNEGWEVIVVWECELKYGKREKTLYDLYNKICQN